MRPYTRDMTSAPISTLAEVIDYLVAHVQDGQDPDRLAARHGYKPESFRRMFRRQTGVGLEQFIRFLTFRTAGDFHLAEADSLGTGGSGRPPALLVRCQAGSEVPGLVVRYGFHPGPLGELMLGVTERGICWLGFQVDESRKIPLARLRRHLPGAVLIHDQQATAEAASQTLRVWKGQGDGQRKLQLDLHGTTFQRDVWTAMLGIPPGATVSYGGLARELGKPLASRAVGGAVGANPVSLLIPCHRVIQASGKIDHYGWGDPRKKAILGLEMAHLAAGEGRQ